jgi:hypothetical protein
MVAAIASPHPDGKVPSLVIWESMFNKNDRLEGDR